MRIRDTGLYKALREVPDLGLTAEQLEKELAAARKAYPYGGFERGDVGAAFVWSQTPQGYNFWAGIHAKQMEARK